MSKFPKISKNIKWFLTDTSKDYPVSKIVATWLWFILAWWVWTAWAACSVYDNTASTPCCAWTYDKQTQTTWTHSNECTTANFSSTVYANSTTRPPYSYCWNFTLTNPSIHNSWIVNWSFSFTTPITWNYWLWKSYSVWYHCNHTNSCIVCCTCMCSCG